jgi:uncharacterized protein (UPF0128 family)
MENNMTDQQKADRLALIAKIAHKQKVEKATKLRIAKVKASSKTLTKRVPKKARSFMDIPKEGDNVYAWTDASKYAKTYYGETLYETTRYDNEWD